jgi:hypothetical protein
MWHRLATTLHPQYTAGHISIKRTEIKFTTQYNEFGERELGKKRNTKKVSRMNAKKIRFLGIIRHA